MQIAHVKGKASAALLHNNLVSSATHCAYVHGGAVNEVHIFRNRPSSFGSTTNLATTKVSVSPGRARITQIRFCNAFGTPSLVVLYGGTIALYSGDGATLTGVYNVANTSPQSQQLAGITTSSDGKALYIGQGTGTVLCFTGSLDAPPRVMAGGHSTGITQLAVGPNGLLSADENGSLVSWTPDNSSSSTLHTGQGYPITSIQVRHGQIITGFASGHLRFFEASTGRKLAEVAAHSRSISAIDVHPTRKQVASASEDSFLSVWTLPDSTLAPYNKLTAELAQTLLTGVQYVGTDSNQIAVVAYDSRFVSVLTAPN
jgi:WD40 repeat protein